VTDLYSAGLTVEQSKKVKDLAKKIDEEKEREEKRAYSYRAPSSYKRNNSYTSY